MQFFFYYYFCSPCSFSQTSINKNKIMFTWSCLLSVGWQSVDINCFGLIHDRGINQIPIPSLRNKQQRKKQWKTNSKTRFAVTYFGEWLEWPCLHSPFWQKSSNSTEALLAEFQLVLSAIYCLAPHTSVVVWRASLVNVVLGQTNAITQLIEQPLSLYCSYAITSLLYWLIASVSLSGILLSVV